MNTEIERRYLVADLSVIGRATVPPRPMKQAYLATGKTNVRVCIVGGSAWLTAKGTADGSIRREYEYPVPVADAKEMMEHLAVTDIVENDRYEIDEGVLWIIDVFKGANAPLALAEVELESPVEGVDPPPWLGDEVSTDLRYQNVYLAVHPYSAWNTHQRDGGGSSR